ncbi:MAG TPA: HPr family phosphocarrier protein, partial [Candidatus Omnitrophota bacterium]|nr:HPr family phosphocarrier protein [Candidatus Omnitrophota bacterium]
AAFVDVAKKFKSVVTVVKGEDRVNGRSIMALRMLRAQYQTSLLLIVEGEDAPQAMKDFEKFFAEEATKFYPDNNAIKSLLGIFFGLCLLVLILLILIR